VIEGKMNERHRLQSSRCGTLRAMRGGTLLGVFVGLVLGLAVAAAIAYFLGKSGLTGSPAAPGAQ
jgi:hypothetical protein